MNAKLIGSTVLAVGIAGAMTVPAAAAAKSSPPPCNKHNKAAVVVSAKRVGNGATVRANIGHEVCAAQGTGVEVGKKVVTIKVPASATVMVITNHNTGAEKTIPAKKLARYIHRKGLANDGNTFYYKGPRTGVSKFEQLYEA